MCDFQKPKTKMWVASDTQANTPSSLLFVIESMAGLVDLDERGDYRQNTTDTSQFS